MTKTILPSNRNFALVLLIFLMIVAGCFRICSTYGVFWQTWDEPFHIAAGMEWLDKGHYTYERLHPPLARVMSALGLYLNGIRGVDNLNSPWIEGNAILQSGGTYEQNLTLARIGILPFFILASSVVALWARNCGGTATSLLATLLFTTLPPILAHSGLATLDMACAALVATALFSLTLWLNRPTVFYSFLLGITVGLAILSKFSALAFLLVSGGLIVAICSFGSFRRKKLVENADFPKFRRRFSTSVIALLLCAITIWAGYRFSFAPLGSENTRPYETVDRIVGTEGVFHDITYFILEHTNIPAPEFTRGINGFRIRNQQKDLAYLMGDIRGDGWWYFYPIMLLVKTPLPFILLSVIGFFFVFRNIFHKDLEWLQLSVPAIALMGILAIGMLGNVYNGIRQMLSVYPLLAIMAHSE